MQKGGSLKSAVIKKVECIVCDCVNKAFTTLTKNGHASVYVDTLYDGSTNIPLVRRMARSAVFIVAHDRFGISYNELSYHSRICTRNIMRSVKVYKESPDNDAVVNKINELIEVELKKFPIL